MVIRKGLRGDQGCPEPAQHGEEFFRPADPGKGGKAGPGKALAVHWLQDSPQYRTGYCAQPLRCGPIAEQHDRVGAGEPRRDWLAQRSGRNDAAISKAVLAIHDNQRQILRHPWVLKAVVEQDDSSAGFGRSGDAGGAVARHPARRSRRDQQRLVADRGGILQVRSTRVGPASSPP
jgi:hypothetical protein